MTSGLQLVRPWSPLPSSHQQKAHVDEYSHKVHNFILSGGKGGVDVHLGCT